MANKPTGHIIELDALKEHFGLKGCQEGSLHCRNCRYNNFGEQREQLGKTCGVVIILDAIRKVTYNYNEKYNPEDEVMNKIETEKQVEGLYFEKEG